MCPGAQSLGRRHPQASPSLLQAGRRVPVLRSQSVWVLGQSRRSHPALHPLSMSRDFLGVVAAVGSALPHTAHCLRGGTPRASEHPFPAVTVPSPGLPARLHRAPGVWRARPTGWCEPPSSVPGQCHVPVCRVQPTHMCVRVTHMHVHPRLQ